MNTALTLLNWIIGNYILEYEQKGKDRAAYGQKLCKTIAEKLKAKGLKSLGERNFYLCKDFCLAYPQILQTVSAKSNRLPKKEGLLRADPKQLLGTLSFSHFIELLRADSLLKRTFYGIQAIKNGWSVRELQGAINSLFF